MRGNIFENRYHDTTKRFQGFIKLMMVWKGSVFRLIWHDLLAFILGYSFLSILYRNVFVYDDSMREWFHLICIASSRFSGIIPITFLTGFYVTQVVTRYWDQFVSLPWPDRLAYKLVSYIPGKTPYHQLLRRTVMRYINLSTVLVFRLVASKVHARFPDYASMVKAGLLLPHEAVRLESIDARTPHETTWTPILWAVNLLQCERTAGRITVEAPIFASLIAAFDYLDNCNRRIFNHGWVNFPLAYTQVATLSVYSYLFASMFAHQFLVPSDSAVDTTTFQHINVTFSTADPFDRHSPDIYIPIFTILEFIGYMGWIKVAETLLNPWGDDDEDFQINYLIDRNFQVSYLIVDEAITELKMEEDPFHAKGEEVPSELPYYGDDIIKEPKEKIKILRGCSFEKCGDYKILRKTIFLPIAKFRYRRQHRCQSTRSRLRSLNENRRPVASYPKHPKMKRVHKISEMSSHGDERPGHRLEDGFRSVGNFTVEMTMPKSPPRNRNGFINNNKVTFTSERKGQRKISREDEIEYSV